MKIACVDVGSTFTKAVVVSGDGELLGTADHRTTVESDVLIGLDAAVAATGVKPDELLVCSSAGGGLRLAVVGYERLVTAQAGARVGLSAGARVVHVAAGRLDGASLAELRAARPDVVLLVGGADGGDRETITHNARRLARARWRGPVVLAGNSDCRDELTALLTDAGVPVTATANVLPAIGRLDPGPARAAIREVFLRHVIGGKHLSRGGRFASLVKGATPDIVLTGADLIARRVQGDLLVVDVGGATTDVYSVISPTGEPGEAEVAGTLRASRTVEGDLGMRWSARGVVAAARAERLIGEQETTALSRRITSDPAVVTNDTDQWIAQLAITVALRRHARGEPVEPGGPRRGGRDLRAVSMVIGSGGVLRHCLPGPAVVTLSSALRDEAGGWPLPRSPKCFIDSEYLLAAVGLLAQDHPAAAFGLLNGALI